MKQLYNIQALRGLAAMMVVLHHLAIPIPFFDANDRSMFHHGQAGVDIFFIISGFIMAYGALQGPDEPAAFMRRRLIRIIPLYWLVTGIVFALTLTAPRLFPLITASWTALAQSLLFIPQPRPPVLLVAWTLNFEMLFYVIFAMGLVWTGRARFIVPVATIGALVLIGLTQVSQGYLFQFFTDPIMLEFCAGIGLALVCRRLTAPKSLLGLAGLLGVIVIFAAPYPPGVHRWRIVYWGRRRSSWRRRRCCWSRPAWSRAGTRSSCWGTPAIPST